MRSNENPSEGGIGGPYRCQDLGERVPWGAPLHGQNRVRMKGGDIDHLPLGNSGRRVKRGPVKKKGDRRMSWHFLGGKLKSYKGTTNRPVKKGEKMT